MGYSTLQDVENIIAQSLTSATTSTLDAPGNLINVGRVLDTNLITEDLVNSYISYVDGQIDSFISVLYKTPLNENVDIEASLYSPISEYNHYLVFDQSYPFQPGDIILLVSGSHQERHTIDEQISYDVYSTVDAISYEFPAGTRVVRLKYPDPIPLVSARLAAADIYDKYFSSENSPDQSAYGALIRKQARADINNILNGRTVLHGQHRIGRWAYNPNVIMGYDLPRGSENTKDLDSMS